LIAIDATLKTSRGRRRAAPVPTALREWLRQNPQAWAGWPSYSLIDPERARGLAARLVAAGCPRCYFLTNLHLVCYAVAQLREERRGKLERQVAKLGTYDGRS